MPITTTFYCPKDKKNISFCLEDIDTPCKYAKDGECRYAKDKGD